jgi:hypothetical protein
VSLYDKSNSYEKAKGYRQDVKGEKGRIAGKGDKGEKEEMTGEPNNAIWSEDDRKTAASFGIVIEELDRQIEVLRRGVSPVLLSRPCFLGDGIDAISDEERPGALAAYEQARKEGRLLKFVPASGAASRMFRDWHVAMTKGGFPDTKEGEDFLRSLGEYGFYPDLVDVVDAHGAFLTDMADKREYKKILDYILNKKGLNYGNFPKALITFHRYPGGTRTALEEHLVESALIVRDQNRIARVHFTVSLEHEKAVREHLLQVVPSCEANFDTVFDFDVSMQNPATHAIAVDLDKRPFRDEDGRLVFRPAGHGALLANLNALDADIVFVKNIDNIAADSFKGSSVLSEKLLAGHLLMTQKRIFAYLFILENPDPVAEKIPDITEFCQATLHIALPASFINLSAEEKRRFLFDALNRPLRVCGMVKNDGEPGGGPFWVQNRDRNGVSSLQIVEESQIDASDIQQKAIWSSSAYFNPVDIVCGLLDYRGRKFDLLDFADPERSIVVKKSQKGRDILSLERPGLWNGAMAYWNTIFIEVPSSTFNPVKTVKDLLRPAHQNNI